MTGLPGRWEAYVRQTVDHPLPNVDRALVIAGSDKRGTIYGIYEISQQIGVSPWYWWADVPVRHRDALFVRAGKYEARPESAKPPPPPNRSARIRNALELPPAHTPR